MKPFTALLCATFVCAFVTLGLFAQETAPPPAVAPTPAPNSTVTSEEIRTIKEISADQVEAKIMRWLAVGTTVVGALASFVAFVLGKYTEIKDRVRQQNQRMDGIQNQVTAVAQATPPPAAAGTTTTSTTTTTPPVLCALLAASMALSGCAVSTDPATGKTNFTAQVTWADAIAISQAISAAKRGHDGKAIRLLERATVPPVAPPPAAPKATPAPKPRRVKPTNDAKAIV